MNPYKLLVKQAWKLLNVPPYDTRDFVTAVRDCVAERDALRAKGVSVTHSNSEDGNHG